MSGVSWRTLAALCVCALQVGCWGRCGRPANEGVKVIVPAMPTTLDNNRSDPTSWVNYPFLQATLVGLTTLGPDNRVCPGLARSWDERITPEGHWELTFHLREDVRWSDGHTPLIADDFVFGWRRAVVGREKGELDDVVGAREVIRLTDTGASPEQGPQAREQLQRALEHFEVRALGPHTLRVVLEQPRSYFLSRLSEVYVLYPAPSTVLRGMTEEQIRDFYERPGDGHPLALGPFRVEAWDRAGERVRLARNPFTSFAPPSVPGKHVPEVVTLLKSEIGPALFERGRVGFVFVDSAAALRAAHWPDLHREDLLAIDYLAFNTQRAPLDRADVRRALAMALDRQALMAGLLPQARLARTFLPMDLPGAATPAEAETFPGYAPEEARRLLASVGGVHRPLRLVYKAGDSFLPEVAIAERIRAQLARFGVEVELDPRSDLTAELERLGPDGAPAADLHLKRIGADFAHPKTFFSVFERNGNNFTAWGQIAHGEPLERMEALLSQADRVPNPDDARELYTRAQRILVQEQAVIAPIYFPDRYFRVSPKLSGLGVDAFNFLSLKNLQISNAEGAP